MAQSHEHLGPKISAKNQNLYPQNSQITLIQNARSHSEIVFDIRNRSIALNFHLQRPVFALKIRTRPQRPKKPMKAKKGHKRPDLQKIINFINISFKIINKWECNTKKKLFFKN